MKNLKKIAATLICIAAVVMTLNYTVPYIIDITSYDNQINMTVRLKSNTTDAECIAEYSWHTDKIIQNNITTQFEWDNDYSEGELRTENYFSSIFENYGTEIYIEWNRLQIARTGDWNFLITFVFHGVAFTIDCEGSPSAMTDEEVVLNSDSFIGFINEQLFDADVTGIEFTVSFTFDIAGSYLEAGYYDIYEGNQRFSNIDVRLSDVLVGTISIIT